MSSRSRILYIAQVIGRLTWMGAAVVLLAATAAPVVAQTPTPWPTPISTGEYVIYQTVTYGEGGVMLALLFVGAVLLLSLVVHLAERFADR